jgi:adenylate cyclase
VNANQKRRLIRSAVFVGVAVVASLGAFVVRDSEFGKFLELKSYDLRFALRGNPSGRDNVPITILAVDQPTLSRIPDPMMLWQRYFARVIDGLVRGGASVVGIDFIFSDLTKLEPAGQQALSVSLLNAGQAAVPLVLGYKNSRTGVEQPPDAIRFAALASGHNFAFLNLTTDIDDFVRRQELASRSADGQPQLSFAAAVAGAFQDKQSKGADTPLPAEFMLINFWERGHFARESFYKALEAAEKDDIEYLKSKFGGRILLIAYVGEQGDEDLHSTPHYYWRSSLPGDGRRTPGIEIHANTLATILNGNPIRRLPPIAQNGISVTAILLIALSCMVWSPARASLASAIVLLILLYVGMMWAFRQNVWMDIVPTAAGGAIAFGLSQTANFVLEGRERRRLRSVFGRYVDNKVIENILQDSDKVPLRGSRTQVAVMFADIRSFTTRSENASAEDIVWMLNQYFTAMVDAIQKHSGMVSTLIGDGLMAVFGAPLADPDAALHSVEAAREMLRLLPGVNQKLSEHGMAPIEIGVGIHFGEVVMGNMGSPKKMEYTVIGDVVNTAARIEGLTRKVDAEIVVTGELVAAARNQIQAEHVGDFEVKGRVQKVSVYRIPRDGL